MALDGWWRWMRDGSGDARTHFRPARKSAMNVDEESYHLIRDNLDT